MYEPVAVTYPRQSPANTIVRATSRSPGEQVAASSDEDDYYDDRSVTSPKVRTKRIHATPSRSPVFRNKVTRHVVRPKRHRNSQFGYFVVSPTCLGTSESFPNSCVSTFPCVISQALELFRGYSSTCFYYITEPSLHLHDLQHFEEVLQLVQTLFGKTWRNIFLCPLRILELPGHLNSP